MERSVSRRWWSRQRAATLVAGGLVAVSMVAAQPPDRGPVALAVHGGAGDRGADDEDAAARRRALREALQTGHRLLMEERSSVDAVIAAIQVLERSPLFNAGRGAVFTWDGDHELDASVMTGDTLAAGAVAGVRTVRSPIRLARAVMDASPHVLLSGRGAEAFAASLGHEMVPNEHFSTEEQRRRLERLKGQAKAGASPPIRLGTVGAVGLDASGTLAAGTSTGGLVGKRWGRVGDSPLIGAGTYADNRSCAVSATGHGEYFIRYNVAADICARVRYTGVTIETAGRQVLFDELRPVGGFGGVIVMSRTGQVAMLFNTEAMARGAIDTDGVLTVALD